MRHASPTDQRTPGLRLPLTPDVITLTRDSGFGCVTCKLADCTRLAGNCSRCFALACAAHAHPIAHCLSRTAHMLSLAPSVTLTSSTPTRLVFSRVPRSTSISAFTQQVIRTFLSTQRTAARTLRTLSSPLVNGSWRTGCASLNTSFYAMR